MENQHEKWQARYRQACQDGTDLFPATPHPLVVDALDQVEILTRHRPSAIDVGAGNGRHARELARRGYYVLAVENAADAPANTTKHGSDENEAIVWINADIYQWEPEWRVDVVLVAFFHDTLRSLEDTLARLASWTNECGWLVLVGHSRAQAGRAVSGPRDPQVLWDQSEITRWLGESDFRVVKATEVEHPGSCGQQLDSELAVTTVVVAQRQ